MFGTIIGPILFFTFCTWLLNKLFDSYYSRPWGHSTGYIIGFCYIIALILLVVYFNFFEYKFPYAREAVHEFLLNN